MQSDIERLKAANVQVVGLSYDPISVLEAFATSQNIKFHLLSDTGSETIDAYGVHNEGGLPHPGTVVIDKSGIIRGKIFREGYRDRHPTDELVELANSIGIH